MKNLVVLTGAGISAESGIRTFREMGGLWEEYDVMEVASPEGWQSNQDLVLRFYNERRRQLKDCNPNEGHFELARLQEKFNVYIITQNVDDLHERAGSKNILHLHGELTKARGTLYSDKIYNIGYSDINSGDKCENGSQLRPHIVWFGEAVPAMTDAVAIVEKADYFAVVGTSLAVYPAAGLIDYVKKDVPVFIVDPNDVYTTRKVKVIKEPATTGVKKLSELLIP